MCGVKGAIRKTVVLLSGQQRSFFITHASIIDKILLPYDADVAACIWEDELAGNVWRPRGDRPTRVDLEIYRAKNAIAWTHPELVSRLLFKETLPIAGLPLIPDHVCAHSCDNQTKRHASIGRKVRAAFTNVTDLSLAILRLHPIEPKVAAQWYSLSACYQRLLKYEHDNNRKYDVIVRFLFDGAVLGGALPPIEKLNRDLVYIPTGFDYSGLNDRMWITGRARSDVLFNTFSALFFMHAPPRGSEYFCPDRRPTGSEDIMLSHMRIHWQQRHDIKEYRAWMHETNTTVKWRGLPVYRFELAFGLINYDGTCRYHCEGTNVTNKMIFT